MSRTFAFGFACLSVFAVAVPSAGGAAIGFRQLTTAFPSAVQVGTTATVQLRSNFSLDGTYASFFEPAGPTMKLVETKPIDAPLAGRGRPGTPFKFEVTVPKKQMPGLHEFRLATPAAVSSVADLLVTEYPVILEAAKDNGTREKAEPITLPAAVCGLCDPQEDVDCYRFAGKAGETLTFEIYAQRITKSVHDMVGRSGYHMDAILTLLSPTGQVVAMNDNVFGGDSLLTATLAQDGEYVLAVRDTRYGGDPRYSYCVEISRGLPALSTFPLVCEKGKSTKVEVLSIGGKVLGTATVAPPAGKQGGTVRERLTIEGKPTNSVDLVTSPLKQVVCVDATKQDRPFELSAPCGVSGRLAQSGDEHWFAFQAEKDRYYTVEGTARRFHLPLDVMLEVYDAKGKKLLEADDQALTSDAKLQFRAPADGRYLLRVRDLHGRGGSEFVYHLKLEPSGPDFELTGKLYYALLAPGTRYLWFIDAARLNGLDSPIEIRVEGLPEGVRAVPTTIPSGMSRVAIVLEADKSAKVGASLVRITGRAKLGEGKKSQEIVHEAVITCELQSQGGSQGHWPVATSLVGVCKSLDLKSVTVTPAEAILERGGKVELSVKIERSAEYKDPVSLDFTWGYFGSKLGEQLPPGVSLGKGSATRLAGNTLEGKLILEASKDALAVERLPIAVMAGCSVSFSIDTKYASNPVYLTVLGGEKKPANVAKK